MHTDSSGILDLSCVLTSVNAECSEEMVILKQTLRSIIWLWRFVESVGDRKTFAAHFRIVDNISDYMHFDPLPSVAWHKYFSEFVQLLFVEGFILC